MTTDRTDYPFTIHGAPDYALANVTIPRGRTLRVEASAMAYMDPSLSLRTRIGGGLRRMLAGEQLFVNEWSANEKDAEIGIAPGTPGDLRHVYLEQDAIYLQNGSYVASNPEVDVRPEFQGIKGFFSGEGLFFLRCSGSGDLWFNTFGAVIEVDVTDRYVVDTGHIVAFTQGLGYDVRPLAGMKSLFFSGEGLVCRFSGEGTVWIQSRKSPAFIRWADQFRRVEQSRSSSGQK